MTVLVLTEPDDDTARRVRGVLDERGVDCVQHDLGDFPVRLSFAAAAGPGLPWTGWLGDQERAVRLADIDAVYYRRPTDFRIPDQLSDKARRFVLAEARRGLGGVVSALPVRWVSHPARIADAGYKPGQLRVADDVGLRIPRTLITNDGAEVRDFARQVDTLIYKPLSSPSVPDDGEIKLIYATVVDPADLDDEDISLTAHQWQEWIPKRHDVRLTVVGDRCFAVVVHAGSEAAHIDWRSDYAALSYEPVETPAPIASAAVAYLKRFDLAFGAFDFVVTPRDEWYFLECNPNGQWGWIEHETGLPIAAAIADLLIGVSAT